MRTKLEIMEEIIKSNRSIAHESLVEVLLDIRDLLVEQNKPKPQHHEFNISQV